MLRAVFSVFLIVVHLVAVQSALAAQCRLVSSTCVDSGTKTINGTPVTRACWDYKNVYDCYETKSLNYCAALVSNGCNETASKCVETDFSGACVRYQKTYRCADPIAPKPTNTIVLDDSHTITEDRIDESQCKANKDNSTCTLAEHKCVEPAETRNINGKDIYKDCWAWEDTYTCLGNRMNTCDDLEAKGCKRQNADTCVERIPNGTCQVWDVAYTCKTPGATRTIEDCSNKGFCLEGKCFDSGSPPDADFAKSVVMLEAARQAGNYMNDDLQIFKGTDERCSIKLSGLKNCCKSKGGAQSNQSILMGAAMSGGKALMDYSFQKGSNYMYDFMFSKGNNWMTERAVNAWSSGAWNAVPSTSMSFYGLTISYTSGTGFAFVGFDPASFALQVGLYLLMQLLSCTEDEAYLQMKRGSNLCHYVGSYCDKKFLGYCYIRKESHCCFNSRLARIINEQGRPQIGKGWGSGNSPNCSGFTTAELEKLDFAAMDLSEFISEIMANAQIPNASTVNSLVQKQSGIVGDKVNQYYQNGAGR
ncbi:conjugal transfer protein TraN [Candidatus Thiothrix anitrata]|uniref:Conjugal transfer protein TraN n=1 Tax=Candidatus Thiothrix anitrata TaxID=2823902 RepID=A0ABX7X8J5_9GAMM|nr:conjugal transfer protein TraN [Candidatus Thiothrix anitrata]QTR51560.1 conjugal transfer protein TraN [Candidatus Thiothrix anitrata]